MTWRHPIRMGDIPREGLVVTLAADEAQRKAIAKTLDLVALDRLEARLRLTPWLDGVQIDGHWSADFAQTCGVTLERLDQALSDDFSVRAVPAGSPHAPSGDEIEIDLDAEDPPDVLESDTIETADYVVEQLALAIDPYPRKPGAEFVQPPEPGDLSPFAALRALQQKPE